MNRAQAQTQPAPRPEWTSPYTHEDERSESGTYYDWQYTTQWQASPLVNQNLGAPQPRSATGEEWWFSHANYTSNGDVVGLITAGYASWPNCYWKGAGCTKTLEVEIGTSTSSYAPKPGEFEKPDHRKGETRGMVARFDLEGEPIWYRGLLPGQVFNVTEDGAGNILAAGVCYSNVWPNDMRLADNPIIRWNNDPAFDYTTLDCGTIPGGYVGRVGFVTKLAPNGDVLWTTILTSNTGPQGFLAGSSMFDVVERIGNNGPEYWVVGLSSGTGSGTQLNCIYRLDMDGILIEQVRYEPGSQGTPANWPNATFGYFYSLSYSATEDRLFATGTFDEAGAPSRAIGALIDPNNFTIAPDWFLSTASGPLVNDGGHDPTKVNYTSGGGFVDAGATRIVWPVLANYAYGQTYSGPHEANLFVHGLDLSGNLNWTTDLGKVHAYDMQSDMTATMDGKVAVVSSVRDNGPIADGEFTWNEVPIAAQTCVLTDFDYVPEGDGSLDVEWPTTDKLRYWNTNAFVAKLDPTDGEMLWCTMWDADPDINFECSPGDIRNQECMYKISETPDGGLVVSGNTSHNFDDYYLTKLHSDCQSKQPYAEIELNEAGVAMIPGGIWEDDMNVYGTLVVPSGTTLTIQNCTIRFADSEHLAVPTRLIVEPGAVLNVINATLTSMDQCPNSMWDGIVLKGDESATQGSGITGLDQAYMNLKTSTLENARGGVVIANAYQEGSLSNVPPELRSGGIIRTTDATFRNNRHDVSFSPYENFTSGNTQVVTNNRSSFIRTKFITEGLLANPDVSPAVHATLAMVRGITFSGCQFSNDLVGLRAYEFYDEQGWGIRSISSSFRVQAHCNVPVAYGQPCPAASEVLSTFDGLHRGIRATTMDLSRTFSVSKAEFTDVNLGIRMDGIHDAAITESSFAIPDAWPDDNISTLYGIYSEQCTGYKIEENDFFNAEEGIERRKAGLVIRNSGDNYNTFYNNSFDGLRMGTAIQGDNAGPGNKVGLEVKCNDYGVNAKNAFDVALTGANVTVQATQGGPVDQNNDETLDDPAGNRFSAHTSADNPESDWYVGTGSNFVEYFHHSPTSGNRTKPEYYDVLSLAPNQSVVGWPGKATACPSNFERRKSQLRELSGLAHDEWVDAKDAYDATKDNGDTYSLLVYVSDPTKSSAQVRNALQSVAPKVSAEVWQAAFERSTPMQPWHITQALLSNSPLEGEVLKMVVVYGLPTYYADLVYSGQSGDASLLAKLQSEVARYAGDKAEALTDLGNKSWLDSLDLGGSLDSLKLWHLYLPSDNSGSTLAGVLSAKRDLAALQLLAQAEETSSSAPEVYAVVKRYAVAEQQGGWNSAAADHAYIQTLAAQRETMGSALAYGWREALGEDLPEEIIIFPGETPKRALSLQRSVIEWPQETQLEAFPNPTDGPIYITYEVPDGTQVAELRVVDVSGREMLTTRLVEGPGVRMLNTDQWAAGLYVAELRLDGAGVATTKLTVR